MDYTDSSQATPGFTHRVRQEIALMGLGRTVRYAQVRCLSRSEIIARICDLSETDHLGEYIGRLLEFELTAPEVDELVAHMNELAGRTETVTVSMRRKIDRTMLRLVRVLPSDFAARFSEPYVDHSLKGRRSWAYAALREKRISATVAAKLADTFRRWGDQEALELIARNPERVVEVGADFLLNNLKERYWRARVFEALLSHDRPCAIARSSQYPFEFAHAVGRSGDLSLLGTLRSLFEANSADVEFISIYAYALGKIGAGDEVESLRQFILENWGPHGGDCGRVSREPAPVLTTDSPPRNKGAH